MKCDIQRRNKLFSQGSNQDPAKNFGMTDSHSDNRMFWDFGDSRFPDAAGTTAGASTAGRHSRRLWTLWLSQAFWHQQHCFTGTGKITTSPSSMCFASKLQPDLTPLPTDQIRRKEPRALAAIFQWASRLENAHLSSSYSGSYWSYIPFDIENMSVINGGSGGCKLETFRINF